MTMTEQVRRVCAPVRQTSFDIHVFHGHGHLEKAYENALVHRLRKACFNVEQQHPIKVYDEDGTQIGDYISFLCALCALCVLCG